jgi:transposase
MRQKSGPEKQPAEEAIKDIRRGTRRHFSAEDKIRIVPPAWAFAATAVRLAS